MNKFIKDYEEFRIRNCKPEITYEQWWEIISKTDLVDDSEHESGDDFDEWEDTSFSKRGKKI